MTIRPHIAYILAPLPSTLLDTNSEYKTRIIKGRRRTEDEQDEVQLRLISGVLLSLKKDATFDALYTRLPFKWIEPEPYDTVSPFGDFRQIDFKAFWIFDLQNDVLLHINRNRRAQLPLSILRSRLVTLEDMKRLGPPVPSLVHPKLKSEMPCWKPDVQIDERNRVFIHRILRDFDRQWRHILRNEYNTITLRAFARAVIRISTLDFEIYEETGSRHGVGGEWVYITELPSWEPLDADVVLVGGVYVFVCHSIQDGLCRAKEHAKTSQKLTATKRSNEFLEERPHYLILTVKHIVLCRAMGPNMFTHTAPEPLLNGHHGVGPPSNLALDYLLWAIAPAINPIATPLLTLPTEVQNIILGYISEGSVAAAKLGCHLGVGTPFLWKDGSLDINVEDVRRDRDRWLPAESQLHFSDGKVGITYRGRT